VTKNVDVPVYQEKPGTVPSESLAAESARTGGAFASNPGQCGGAEQAQTHAQAPHHEGGRRAGTGTGTGEGSTAANKATSLGLENAQTARGTSSEAGGYGKPPTDLNLENQAAYGGAAPSYVAAQRYRDEGGPHGKNLTEGGFEGSGTAGGALPEPGSAEDPTRVATRDLKASMGSQGRDAGPRQEGSAGEGRVREGEGKTWFTPLGGDEQA
jgi:hypothetical protein